MRKIINPYVNIPGYSCFGCAPHNDHGLQMDFFEDGDEIIANWEPHKYFQGYGRILHGGIQAALMDEIANWYVFIKLKTAGVTSKLDVSYKKPANIQNSPFKLASVFHTMQKNVAIVKTFLMDKNGTICTEGFVSCYTFPEKVAKERFWYPGVDAFFEK